MENFFTKNTEIICGNLWNLCALTLTDFTDFHGVEKMEKENTWYFSPDLCALTLTNFTDFHGLEKMEKQNTWYFSPDLCALILTDLIDFHGVEKVERQTAWTSSPDCNENPAVTTKEERGIAMESGTTFSKKRSR